MRSLARKSAENRPPSASRIDGQPGFETRIDAISGKPDAVVRESADLLYNLTVLWASAGVKPDDVWREMERRERLLGIAEKLPKSPVKVPKGLSKAAPVPVARRRIVALENRLRKRQP